jgi:hypothetical protein
MDKFDVTAGLAVGLSLAAGALQAWDLDFASLPSVPPSLSTSFSRARSPVCGAA